MNSGAIAPRPSSTLVLLREAEGGQAEVLLLQRADRGDQNSLRWVFPGGLVDASDDRLRQCFHDLDDLAASARLGLADGGLDYWAAALRETLEEAGLLLAVDDRGQTIDAEAHAETLRAWRDGAHTLPRGQGGAAFAALCKAQGWRLPGLAVLPIAHWITPLGLPKRFDTRFFVAAAPRRQEVRIDGVEIVDHRWVVLSDLADGRAELSVRGPTLAVAKDLSRHGGVDAALAWARGLGLQSPVQPRLAIDARGQLSPTPPWHPAYAEIGRIDPQGAGLAHNHIRSGVAVALAKGFLLRITAPNAGVMTGPGTNTYLLRAAGDDWVLIDPGPDDASHVRSILAALRERAGRLAAILVTHTHVDHSPAAQALKAATGAPCLGRLADHRGGQDPHFAPDTELVDNQRLDFGGDCVLRVIHTPGHASNHLCYLHEGLRLVFTGDHVMQGSTVVINPPDGEMATYLASLQRLADEAGVSFDAIAPGHGFLIDNPARTLEALTVHRRRREAKVRQALSAGMARTLDELVMRVYDDVPAQRHALARRSLLAHLLHLRQQGHAEEVGEGWQARA